jgi:predicted nucleotide-binding protein
LVVAGTDTVRGKYGSISPSVAGKTPVKRCYLGVSGAVDRRYAAIVPYRYNASEFTLESGSPWIVEHVVDRRYDIICALEYDARNVTMVAFSRTTGEQRVRKSAGKIWHKELDVVRRGERVEADFGPKWAGAPLPFSLWIRWLDEYGKSHEERTSVLSPERVRPDLRSPVPPGFATRAANASRSVSPRQYAGTMPTPKLKDVFVVHGRNEAARQSMFTFLRAIGLNPIEWSRALAATGSASPYIGEVLDTAFNMAQAIVVLMTPDEVAYLLSDHASGADDPDTKPGPQARPNVLFEAGIAMGRDPKRTVLVELGTLRPFSDVAGRHAVRLNDTPEKRNDLAQRLKTAGCDVDTSGTDWLQAGDFSAPKVPGGPVGRRVPSSGARGRSHLDARYLHRTSGSDRITIQNVGSEEVLDLTSPNAKDFHGRLDGFPVPRLPVGKSVTLIAMAAMGVPDTWDLVVNGRTASGEEFSELLFLDLNG